jgi:sorbitol/mannitol transport system permease protein
MFFPIFWMVLSAFKREIDAIAVPPLLVFQPTLENFSAVQGRANYFGAAWNSIVISVGSTVLGTLLALPAAYAMAFYPGGAPRTFSCGCCPPR